MIGAGLCTTIGSTVSCCTHLANHNVLASALGVSAGVMIYVSFAEIFCVKAVEGFEEAGYTSDEATRYATFAFFGGIVTTVVLDACVHFLAAMGGNEHAVCDYKGKNGPCEIASAAVEAAAAEGRSRDEGDVEGRPDAQDVVAHVMGKGDRRAAAGTGEGAEMDEEQRKKLKEMGLLTGVAVAIHNFPEGLATFVAALADKSLGVAIAIAIALHNIPEGVCVAMPVYFATGSRWKGFLWSFLSGVSEPIGGLVGYLVLYGNRMSDLTYGILFALVAGMMVYISLVELIPTALRYDPENKYVTTSIFLGMAVMAASLLMFTA